jgi:inward rectifier potassium channel
VLQNLLLNSDNKKYDDLGLGVKASAGRYRILNKDGSFNVQMTNLPLKKGLIFFII